MATATVTLPAMGKISLVTTWMATVLYGVNCMMYALCMYLLVSKRYDISSRWIVVLTSSVLIILSTAYIAASLQQILEAFVYIPIGVQDYATLYFLDYTLPMRTLKDLLSVTLNFVQDIVLIWRLHIVFSHDWRISAFFILLDLVSISLGYAVAILTAIYTESILPANTLIYLIKASWALNVIVNISVTLAIALRLWWMGRNAVSFHATLCCSSGNPYSYSIHVAVESGAIFSTAQIVMLALFAHENGSPFPYALPSIDVGSQLAVLTPLVIVVRVGLHRWTPRVAAEAPGTQQSVASAGSRARFIPPLELELHDAVIDISHARNIPNDVKV